MAKKLYFMFVMLFHLILMLYHLVPPLFDLVRKMGVRKKKKACAQSDLNP